MLRCKYELQPYPVFTTVLSGKNIPLQLGYRSREPKQPVVIPKPETPPGTMKKKIVQTMFRESEAQTDPYVVDLVENTDKGLEILTLSWLSFNKGLPAGMNEVALIERGRQVRAWEAALPTPFDETSRKIREIVVRALEINQWKYREELIAAVASLRMELARNLMKEQARMNKSKYETRLNKYIQAKKDEKNRKINEVRSTFNRDIRKLFFKQQKLSRKYRRWNIIKQFTDKTSELYAPQIRFGEDPRNMHEKINEKFHYWHVFSKAEIIHHTQAHIPQILKPAFNYHLNSKPRVYNRDLCIRLTKWTEQNLEKLHTELRNLRRRRNVKPRYYNLKKKVQAESVEVHAPTIIGVSPDDEDFFQACLFLQKIIKGRAIQAVMFEGRVKCQELIEELKSTHALQNDMEDVKADMRRKIYGLQRQAELNELHEMRKNEILCALEGKTTGQMLDFLAKELLRLQDERKTHALALTAVHERNKREALEAGRRQVEEQRRREHDEMFKQVLKMHQNTVQEFLDSTMVLNRNWLANREAREYITELAKTVDRKAFESALLPMFSRATDIREEEIIADLIHNFALPEAEKRIVREKMQKKQRNYLKICHDEVYSNIEKAVQGLRTRSGQLMPLPKRGKHKIPPLLNIKYLRLKRMHESSSSTPDSPNSQISSNKGNITHRDTPEEIMWSTGFSKQDIVLEKSDNDESPEE